MYKFLFTGKWMGYLLLAAVFATACVGLGRWQFDRRTEVVNNINKIKNNYSAAPLDIAQARGQFQTLNPAMEWTPVSLRGIYDTADQRVVRNRPLNGHPGYEVVVPLKLVSGDTVIIDRGWLPIGNREGGHPDTVPQPVSGPVTVVARLRPSEPQVNRGAPAGQLASIDLENYAKELGYPILTGAYGELATESPAAAVNPTGFAMPSIDEGSHLSYAMQWFAFGVLAFVGYGYAARQQVRADQMAAEDGVEESEEIYGRGSKFQPRRKPLPRRVRRNGKPRRATAEETEDALLDAQGF
ncbi:SURF1 family protein [Paenarthrobacter sp. Z7-10]|uniref:SURF1 family cytochrome oxidase biogenesis protein n=1 Tax=Paenarthrobacter sp. Z7-10 TaxID=2787635 RepID=UPI0022A8E994|nr:SURF1 family protein [Paenarthrobacter sp. Z7-10]MCZ2402646.1 SURF1 family protein [Paenarthrobacter sp. Z7-10]